MRISEKCIDHHYHKHEPNPRTHTVYQKLLSLPDFQLIIRANECCDCGVNAHIIQQFQRLKSQGKDERTLKTFLHANQYKPRKECCGQIPVIGEIERNGDDDPEGEIDERAVLWLKQHPDGVACKMCPHCISFPLISKLSKVCSHVSLLQAKIDPDLMDPNHYKESGETGQQAPQRDISKH